MSEIRQQVPTPPAEFDLAPSQPLHQLAEYAPSIPDHFDLRTVRYAFSNDESAASYDSTQSRTSEPEYRSATNRTAVIVGEGSLMAALPMIPEATIILLDKSPEMCAFMGGYVGALREAETFQAWGNLMGFNNGGPGTGVPRAMERLSEQVVEWFATDYKHPLREESVYAEAHELAQQKAIIPWRADLGSKRDMKRLGRVLKAYGANVTMLNLTNSIAGQGTAVEEPDRYAKRLGHLPITPRAPIIATAFRPKPPSHPMAVGFISEAVGPFFGLDDLVERGETPLPERENAPEGAMAGLVAFALVGALLDLAVEQRENGNGGPQMEIMALDPDGAKKIDLDQLPPDIRAILSSEAFRR